MSQQLARLDAVIGAVGDQPNIDAPGAQLGDDDSQRALRTLMILAMVGIASIAVYAAQLGTITQAATTASVGILVAGACVVVGGLLGFLFGIPRTLQQERAGSAEPATRRVEYLANTNLEQI